jgi:acyl-CoA thioesterase I
MSTRALCSLVLGVLCAGAAWSADTTPATPEPAPATAAGKLGDLRVLTTALADTKRPITWLFTGDSITHGAKHTGGCRSYPELFSERIRWELGFKNKVRMRDVIINTGVSGHRCPDLLGDWNWRVTRFKPDVVSFNLGMNDCTAGEKGLENYRKQLIEIVERIRAIPAIPMIHVPSPALKGDRAAALQAYCEVVREVAAAKKVILVDHQAHFAAVAPEAVALKKLMNDDLHPNGAGHAEMANAVFLAMGLYDPQSPTCKLGLPAPKRR